MELNVLSVFVIFLLQKRSGMKFDGISTSCHIHLCKIPALSADDEARAFWDSIKKRRGKWSFQHFYIKLLYLRLNVLIFPQPLMSVDCQ